MSIASLELDLDLFSGPFDLLLTLVLREEIDLLELELADIVLAYLDHLEARGELDLETATEFIVLVAALLELKSRLMLAGEDDEELLDIEPAEAAQELLARMLDASRYRSAALHLKELLAREHGVRFRAAPPPAHLLQAESHPQDPPAASPDAPAGAAGHGGSADEPAPGPGSAENGHRAENGEPAERVHDPAALGAAIGRLLRTPPTISLRHIHVPRVSLGERLAHLRALLGRGQFSFEEAVAGADRVTVAVTVFALLELYKRGEAAWEQHESFGEIQIRALPAQAHPADAPAPLAAGAGAAA